jgi:hypothetical protein
MPSRRLVEDAGRPLYCGWFARRHTITREVTGLRWVGGRPVKWKLWRTSITVIHPRRGRTGEPVSYRVGLSFTRLPSGGGLRWWWECPACGRRVDVLDLPPDRDRLACRRCCGLVYRSQYARGRVRRRKRRPAVRVVRGGLLGWLLPRR